MTEACYLESGLRLDPAFAPEIVLIRRNTDPWLAHRQGQIIPQLDAANVIRIALRSAAPAKRWQGILAAAAMLNDQELLDLRGALASTAWLPLTNGSVAKAEDFIFVSEIEEEVSRVVADSGGLFHEVLELEAAVRSNEAFPRLALAIFPARETALMMLGEMMSAVDKYRIGALDPSTFDLSAFRVAFSQAPWHLMPAFTVLDSVTTKLSLEACENHLLPNLMREISLDRTGEILSYLSEVAAGAGSAQASATRVFNWYLSSIVRRAGFMQILATLRLKSRKGTWKAAAQLCPLAQNIRDDDILDAQQESILRPAIGSPRIHPQDASSTIDHVNELARLPQDWEERVERAADTLGNYFDRWEGRIQPEVIGGFLSLLGEGPGLDKLVSRFLGNRTVPGTRAQLGWVQLEGNIGGAGEDAQTVMARYRFMVDLVESDTVSLSNLLGQPFQARLGEQVTNIVVGDPFFTSLTIPGKNLALQQIFLRMIDPDDYQESELSSILQDSAEYVLRRVYLQSPDLGELWSELSESEQLDIGVARNLLLDQATFYLRQLGVQRYEPIAAALAESDAARRLEAEEESLAKSSPRAADTAMQKARARLRAVLESDVDAQRAVLTAVRRKLEDDQYKPKSVPFELFQNADDAAVELAEMMGDAPIPVEVSRFVVLVDDQSVMFAHWGRRINQYNSGGFSGRGRGFDRDLEKMLTLSASDKFNSVGTPHAVTGKFGLGFKSTLLVSDRPIVMSGRLAFEVVGGIYPKKLEPSERQRISTRLESGERMEAQRDATVICLPLTEKAQTDEILARFTTAAPLLLAFSRRIKSIDLQEANGTWLRTSWKEYDVPRARGVTTGRLGTLAESSREHTIGLRIACSSGSLLFALGPRGFRALPLDLPTIWATTPTEHVLRLGFCINGPFAVDVGRTLLARESQANVELVDEMGHDLAHRFESLVTAASDWPDFTMSLGLAPDLSAYDLWDSLWDLLATNLSQTVTRSQPDHAQALVLRLLWPDQGPIERFVRRCRVLPTKLWSTHRTLTRADEVQWTATGTLDEQDVFTEISGWQAFTSRVTSAQIVSDSRVAATLRSLKSLLPASWRRFTLVDVMTWALNDGHLVEPELSAQFGRVLTKELVATLKGGNEAQKREYEDIQELLSKLVFRAEDGRLRSANELLIPGSLQSEHRDESRRAAFAPESKKLAADYGQSALPFFELCRSGLAAPSKEMAEWAFSATDPETRCKVLEYLLDGERASPLARDLRTDGRWSWLNELATSPLLERFDPREARLPYDLWLDTDTDSSVPAVMTPTVDAGVALNRIHEWWRSVAKDRTERYERRVYLDGKAPPLSSNLDCLSDFPGRSNWLQLLLLGAMHTIGRTSPEQHRGFLRLCRDEGWIDIFAAPTVDAEAWMRVIEDYLNQQVDDSEFSHWMKQFVGIFQVSRWLNEYAELFVQADRLAQPVQLDAIISPRASSDFQGSGLDAPPLGRTLGIGACFVMRELFRAGALSNPTLHRHCYVPAKPVRRLLVALGSSLEIDRAHYRQSEEIHKFLVEHLGPERATFGGSFDLPLLALSDDPDLQMEFLKFHLPEEIDDSI
ncbi:MAG: hypothetical protein JW395_4151 [Nitrospira sp.]|nr:hypothetical protein [Nitrospira sp.]